MKKILITIWLALIIIPNIILPIFVASAQSPIPQDFDISILAPEGETPRFVYEGTKNEPPVVKAILEVINVAIYIIGSVAVLTVVIGGVILITASGNDNMVQRGKTVILYAILGIVIAFSAYIISSFVQSIFF